MVIAGAGPAGMMLAHQLASRGIDVHVLERHADFDREFRGELIGPSVLPVLEKLGILSDLFAPRDAADGSRARRARLAAGPALAAPRNVREASVVSPRLRHHATKMLASLAAQNGGNVRYLDGSGSSGGPFR